MQKPLHRHKIIAEMVMPEIFSSKLQELSYLVNKGQNSSKLLQLHRTPELFQKSKQFLYYGTNNIAWTQQLQQLKVK